MLPFDPPILESVQTVKIPTLAGTVSADKIGRTLMHEHVFCRVRQADLALSRSFLQTELERAATAGITTIVDLTTYVLPDSFIDALSKVPVNIVCCAGYYLRRKIPAQFRSLDSSELAERLSQKFVHGIGRHRVKPGIIKVATAGRTFTPLERNVLTAAAIVHQRHNVPIAVHSCRGGKLQLEFLIRAGANPRSVFFSHMEMELKGSMARPFAAVAEDVLWILRQGAFVFFGDFSVSDSPYRRRVIALFHMCCKSGFAGQLFISADTHWSVRRGRMMVRGTPANSPTPRTYCYTTQHIIPLLLRSGVAISTIEQITARNPEIFFRAHAYDTAPYREINTAKRSVRSIRAG